MWNASSRPETGTRNPHQCRRHTVLACQMCRLPTNARFLADGFCPACRLAMVKAELAEMTEAEASEPTISDDELDEMWANYADFMG